MSDLVRAADTPYAAFTPVAYEAQASSKVSFCGCKSSNNKTMCDGSHQ